MWIWRQYQDGMPLHTFVYYWDVLGMYFILDDGDPHDVDMESKGNGGLDTYDDACVIAYL